MTTQVEASSPNNQTSTPPANTTPATGAEKRKADPAAVAALLDRKRPKASGTPSSQQPTERPGSASATSSSTSGGATPEKSSASTSAGPKDGQASATKEGEASKPDDAGGDSKLAARLAKVADKEAKVRDDRKALAAERAALEADKEGFGKFKTFTEAKTKGDRLGALRVLFDDGEITGDLYTELTDHVLNNMGDGKLTKEQAEKLLDKKLEDERKKGETAEETRANEIRTAYVERVDQVFQQDPDKWPLVGVLGIDDGDIHKRVEAHFAKTRQTLRPAEVLDLFEGELAAKVEATKKYAPKKVEAQREGDQPANGSTTITSSWTRDQSNVSTDPDKPKERTLKEAREAIKRKHQLRS